MSERISVVIPTHNRSQLLSAALDCVLSQSFPPAEIMVVDDGSVDATSALLDRYEGTLVRTIRIENSGHLVARNVGLRAASADLVAFCDSDDLWRPSFLQMAMQLWRQAPDLTASYSNFAIVRDDQWSRLSKFETSPAGFWDDLQPIDANLGRFDTSLAERLIDFQPFFPTGMIVRKRAFIALGGWDEYVSRIIGADFATALRAGAHPPIGIMQQPLVGIRKHRTNLSSDTEKMNLGNACVLEHVLATRPELTALTRKIHASVAQRRRDALDAAFTRRDLAEVRRIYHLIPPARRRPAARIKASVATLPAFVSTHVNEVALRLGSAKASLVALATAKPWADAGRIKTWADAARIKTWPDAARMPRIDRTLPAGGFSPLTSR